MLEDLDEDLAVLCLGSGGVAWVGDLLDVFVALKPPITLNSIRIGRLLLPAITTPFNSRLASAASLSVRKLTNPQLVLVMTLADIGRYLDHFGYNIERFN